MTKFEVNDYGEMVALFRALMVAKFARDQIVPELPGSPFIASMFNRLAHALNKMEIERGKPERANWYMEIVPDSERWQIAVRDAAHVEKRIWDQFSSDERQTIAKTHLAPFLFTDEMINRFIAQVDERINARKSK